MSFDEVADLYDRDHHYAGVAIGAYFGRRIVRVSVPAVEPVQAPKPEQVIEPVVTPEPAPAPEPPPALVCDDVAGVLVGVQFENDAAMLLPRSREILDGIVKRLEDSSGYSVEVLAYTDSNGSDEYNYALSNRRARSVEDYLGDQGIARERLSSRGYGELNPIADNATAAGRAKNRRVELRWSMEHCE